MVTNSESGETSKDENYVNVSLAEGKYLSKPPPGEEIVISGISGTFPKSSNVDEYKDNLYNKVQMVTASHRWSKKIPGVPDCSGNIPDANDYDTGFFGVHERQAISLDPSIRLLMEKTIEAIFDAGLNPADFENTKTGVFIGACFSESEKIWFFDTSIEDTYCLTGEARSMLALRIAYFLKLKGPAFITDTACSSSLYALEHAFRALRAGEIDNAIVGGVNICSSPYLTLQFLRLGVLSHDGQCKTFDKDGNGYARSEAIGVIILQKAKNAKRNYGEIVHIKTNCDGFKENGITYPSGEAQRRLLEDFYEECQVHPEDLSYLEAHGTGTFVGDPEECAAVDKVLMKKRNTPLYIGSVKSNIGHSEPASGICSIIKCIIGLENGFIPPNINFKEARKEILPIVEGRLKVVTEKTPLKEKNNQVVIGISSFGFGGGNCHILLRRNNKAKRNYGIPEDNLPRLVNISGRTKEAVVALLDELKDSKLDAELIKLLHGVFRKPIANHLYRGYSIVSKSGEICRYIDNFPGHETPLYIVFGELNNWFDIGHQLMILPSFCNSVNTIQKYLQHTGINIMDILLDKSPDRNNYHIVGSIVVQIGLIDTFKLQDINPVKHFGYSFGELLSAYIDDVLTLPEVISCALAINEINNSVNNLYQNSQFKEHVTTNGVLHSETNLDNLKTALKSADLIVLRKKLLQNLSKILTTSKVWNKNNSKVRHITAEYLLEALTNSNGIFYPFDQIETKSLVLYVGVAPVNNKLKNVKMISLFPPGNKNYLFDLLRVFGNLYLNGFNPQLEKLYPPVNLPVSRGTKMLSSHIKWNHKRKYVIPESVTDIQKYGSMTYTLNATRQEWSYLQGHVIDGRNLFPAIGYLYLVWETLAILEELEKEEMSIIFEDCKFLRATSIPKGDFQLEVNVESDGTFQILQGDSLVVAGKARSFIDDVDDELPSRDNDTGKNISLVTKDIYKELRLRGYHYAQGFRAIQRYDSGSSKALIRWENNWVTFMDNMLQLRILQTDTRLLYVPTYIKKMSISVLKQVNWINQYRENQDYVDLPAHCDQSTKIVRCGHIEINGLIANSIPRRKDLGVPVLEKYIFMPNLTTLELEESVRVNLQILLENALVYKVKLIELIDNFTSEDSIPMSPIIQKVLNDQPVIKALMKIYCETPLELTVPVESPQKLNTETDNILIIASKLLDRPDVIKEALAGLRENGFLLSREALDFTPTSLTDFSVSIVTTHKTPTETLVLLKKTTNISKQHFIKVSSVEFSWIQEIQDTIKQKQNSDIILYAGNEPLSGILGLVNCLRREPDTSGIRCLFMMDEIIDFTLDSQFISQQLDKNIAINIYNNGSWGTYRHLLMNPTVESQSQHCFLNPLVRGDLSSLKWIQGPLNTNVSVAPEQELIHVNYCALNFRDVLTASGKINADAVTSNRLEQECVQGFEFVGKTQSGKKVMAMINFGACATLVLADKYLVWNIPKHMTMEEAVTIPVVYGTVIYGLLIRNQMKRGQSILIHSGTGGVGLAAITTALHFGCTVFTTVGNEAKREFLKKMFPELKDSHIGNSRNLSFEQMIRKETKGKGVDFVLNSLAEEKLIASVRCLAKRGTFVEIGKADLINNADLNLLLFKKEGKFDGIMLDQLITEQPCVKIRVSDIINNGLIKGWIKPLNRTVFKFEEIEQAFRYMATGKHMGKVVVEIRKEEEIECKPTASYFPCYPRYSCDSANTYIIIGGLGGFGLELADWLVLKGARKIILTSRKGITTGYQKLRIGLWQGYGATIEISNADVTTKKGCEELLEKAERLGSVDAIFNLAVVLKDSLFENQTPENFITSFGPKAIATRYLDESSRRLCPNLRHFVIFSSVSCGRGNAGQTNYGMANSIMERICEKRRQDGYPALAIQWGAIGEVGLVAEMQEEHIEIEIGGTLQQKIANCMNVFNTFLSQTESVVVSSMVVAEKRGGAENAENLVDAVINILGVTDVKTISMHATLAELGMDSMTAVEIKQTLEREFEVFLTAKDIRTMTLAKLMDIQKEKQNDAEKENTLNNTYNIFMELSNKTYASSGLLQSVKSQGSESATSPKILFFPGVEGDHGAFETVAAELHANVVSLHYPLELDGETIHEAIENILPLIRKELSKSEPFLFVAHSYGCLYALEIAHRLENEGYVGSITLLDASPTLMKVILFSYVDKGELQTEVICQLLTFYLSPEEIKKQKETIRTGKTWDEKVDISIELNKNKTILDSDLIRAKGKGFYQKILYLESYNPSFDKLKTPVRLLKAKETDAPELGDDYQLSPLLEKPVIVDVIEGNHRTILENPTTINILNTWLSENVSNEEEKSEEGR